MFGVAALSSALARLSALHEPLRENAAPPSRELTSPPSAEPPASPSEVATPEPPPSAEPPYLEVDGGTLEEQKQALP